MSMRGPIPVSKAHEGLPRFIRGGSWIHLMNNVRYADAQYQRRRRVPWAGVRVNA